jgi:hypothetical protein
MTQDEVKQTATQAYASAMAAYWGATPGMRGQLALVTSGMNAVITALNQDDLQSRTADFQTAAATMQHYVLPDIKKLDASVAKMVAVDDTIKAALTDLMKLSSSVSFFKIPGV